MPISLYVIAAAVITLIAVGVAQETRHRDLTDVPTGSERAAQKAGVPSQSVASAADRAEEGSSSGSVR